MPTSWKKNTPDDDIGRKQRAGSSSLKFCRCSGCEVNLAQMKAGVRDVELAKGGKNASPSYAGRYVEKSRSPGVAFTKEGRPLRKRKYKYKYALRPDSERGVEPAAAADPDSFD